MIIHTKLEMVDELRREFLDDYFNVVLELDTARTGSLVPRKVLVTSSLLCGDSPSRLSTVLERCVSVSRCTDGYGSGYGNP